LYLKKINKINKILSGKAIAAIWKGTAGTLCMIVMTLFIMSTGCANDEKEKEEKEPAEISFTEYSLTGAECQWTNPDNYDSKVTVINNKTTLEKYVVCDDGSYPEIDFAKNTLLLAQGTATSGVGNITPLFYRNSANQYTLNVKVSLGITAIAERWSRAIAVSKLSENAQINLDVQFIQ
jgi:hypothetical protein